MSDIDNIVNLQITAVSAAPTRENFGVPLIHAYHTHNVDLVRTYNDPSDMISDGFTAYEPAYLMASAIAAQNPRPPKFKVARGTAAAVQTFTFTVTDNTEDHMVGFDLQSPLGVVTDAHYTVLLADTTTDVAAGIVAIVGPLAGVSAANVGAVVTVTVDTAGPIFYPSDFFGGTYLDTTVAPSTPIASDLANLLNVDPDWYGVSISLLSAVNIAAVGAWVEANGKIFAYTTADTNTLTSGSGIFDTMRDAGYKRSYGQWSGTPQQYGALALMAQRLTADPGSDTWAYKQLSSVNADDALTPSMTNGITANNGNFYKTIKGVAVTIDGRSAQGQFMDLQRGLDALSDDIQSRVYNLIISSEKVPYTTKGIAAVGAEVLASLTSFTGTQSTPGFLSTDPGFEPKVLLPVLKDISPLDKKDRILRNVRFTATAQGAIHTIFIQGIVSF